MNYAKERATPEGILEVATLLSEAAEALSKALRSMNGVIKVPMIDKYCKIANEMRFHATDLENDFARAMFRYHGVNANDLPLFGAPERLEQAREILRELSK